MAFPLSGTGANTNEEAALQITPKTKRPDDELAPAELGLPLQLVHPFGMCGGNRTTSPQQVPAHAIKRRRDA